MLKQQQGIGLLELMLALAVIAMMMVAASRYYQSTQVARRVQIAVESVQALYAANERYVQDYGISTVTLADLTSKGYLPADFGDTANPWGGDITLALASSSTVYLKATFSKVPESDCKNVYNKLHAKFFVKTVDCPTGGGAMAIDMSNQL